MDDVVAMRDEYDYAVGAILAQVEDLPDTMAADALADALGSVRERMTEYEARCNYYAREQGADVIARTLRAAGLPCIVEQTGGFTMVPTVYNADRSRAVMVTDEGGGDAHFYVIGCYDLDADGTLSDEGDETETANLADLPAIVAHFVGGAK